MKTDETFEIHWRFRTDTIGQWSRYAQTFKSSKEAMRVLKKVMNDNISPRDFRIVGISTRIVHVAQSK